MAEQAAANNSHMDMLSQDSLLEIYTKLPIRDKLNLLKVNKTSNEVAKMAFRRQRVLGHAPNGPNHCCTPAHQVCSTDVMPHPFNDNIMDKAKMISILTGIMNLCPNITTLKLVLRNRTNDASYSDLFRKIVELYGTKLECLDVNIIPRSVARQDADETARTVTEYDSLLSGCVNLRHAVLPVVSDAGLALFFENNQQVEFLDNFRLQGNGSGLRKMPASMLKLVIQQPMQDLLAAIADSEGMRSLEVLDIYAGRTGLRPDQVLNFTNLKEIRLHGKGAGFTVDCLRSFSRSPRLERLNLQSLVNVRTFVSNDFKEVFENCKELREIKLNNDAICDNFFLHLSNCKKLQMLQVSSYGFGANVVITNQSLEHISKLTQLVSLEIEYFGGLAFDAQAMLMLLENCQHLERLVIKRSNLVMLNSVTRAKLLELVDDLEAEGKNYCIECEHRVNEKLVRFYCTSRQFNVANNIFVPFGL